MNKNLFVGRLPFDFTDERLRALFADLGTIESAAMVPDPKNKCSRGFGFVVMSKSEEAEAAVAKLNGKRIGEKEIWVTEARPKAPRPTTPDRPEGPHGPRRDALAPRSASPRPPQGDKPSERQDRFFRRSAAPGSGFSGNSRQRKPGGPPWRPPFNSDRGPERAGDSFRGPRSPGRFSKGRPADNSFRGPKPFGFKPRGPGGSGRFRSRPDGNRGPKPR